MLVNVSSVFVLNQEPINMASGASQVRAREKKWPSISGLGLVGGNEALRLSLIKLRFKLCVYYINYKYILSIYL